MQNVPKNILKLIKQEIQEMYDVNSVIFNDNDIIIKGRNIDIVNLYKIILYEKKENPIDIIRKFLEAIFSDDNYENISFEDAMVDIMPRIRHKSLFESLDESKVAYIPWVNDCVIVFVLDRPSMTISISSDLLEKWNVTSEDLYSISKNNLENITDIEEYTYGIEIKDINNNVLMIHNNNDGYDSSRILLDSIYDVGKDYFGSEFLAIIPCRDVLVLSSFDNTLIKLLVKRAKKDYLEIPYPITPHPFVVTMDGIAKWKPW